MMPAHFRALLDRVAIELRDAALAGDLDISIAERLFTYNPAHTYEAWLLYKDLEALAAKSDDLELVCELLRQIDDVQGFAVELGWLFGIVEDWRAEQARRQA